MSFSPPRKQLRDIFDRLLRRYGELGWWPADTPFEVMVGAVLTQNTAWTNVERAISNLKQAGALHLDGLLALPQDELAELIRPSGYYNLKAERLQNLCRFLIDNGGEEGLRQSDTKTARKQLLSVKGVGAETADDILLYALDRPVFVIDAYTRRIFSRLGVMQGEEPYDELRIGFEQALGPDVVLFKEYHALIVRHAKEACNKKPRCSDCCLGPLCASQTG
jgi:endonuclease-3 related protein